MNEREESGEREFAAELRLRPERPPVTRLSRRVLSALAVLAAISVSGALIWALYQGQRKSTSTTESICSTGPLTSLAMGLVERARRS